MPEELTPAQKDELLTWIWEAVRTIKNIAIWFLILSILGVLAGIVAFINTH